MSVYCFYALIFVTGFNAPELAARIGDCHPKVVVAASCGIEIKRIIPYVIVRDRELIVRPLLYSDTVRETSRTYCQAVIVQYSDTVRERSRTYC